MRIHGGLWKGSAILLVTFGIYNFFNFLFQLSMARMLTIIDYGILATLFSIIYVGAVFTESVQTIITKYSSQEDNGGKLKDIIKKSIKKSAFVSSALFILFLVVSLILSPLLEIDYLLLSITGIFIFLAFMSPITRGVMQGKKRFFALGTNMILEAGLKLILATSLVFIGLRVYGAIIGSVVGVLSAFLLSLIPLKSIMRENEVKSKTIGIYNYAKPTFFITLIVVAFYSLDIIIAKIVFPKAIAGAYAVASILSKAIFWGTHPISRAMFPLSSENANKRKTSKRVFLNALFILFAGIITALSLFYFFSGAIIEMFSGKFVYESINVLFYLGIGTSLISLANLILLYKLSLKKTKGYAFLFIFVIIEIILLGYFSEDLLQFSIAFITASAIFLCGSVFLMND